MILNKYTISKQQGLILYRVSYLSLLSSLFAFYNGHYDLVLVPGGVFATSILFWSNPDSTSWRRYVDMMYVKVSLLYQLYRAYNADYVFAHYLLMILAVSWYPIGNYLYSKGYHLESYYAHSMIHVFSNIANIVLYSGYVPPLIKYNS